MRILEELTFPLLESLITQHRGVIAEDEQERLAARFTHMVMVATIMGKDKDPITNEERKVFMGTRKPPPYWDIFLCRAGNPLEIGQYYYTDAFTAQVSTGNGTYIVKAHATTFVLGKLCIFILGRRPSWITAIGGVTLARLWPLPGGQIDLAATDVLTPARVDELAHLVRRSQFPEHG